MGEELLQDGKWLSKNNGFFLSLFGFFILPYANITYFQVSRAKKKKLLKKKVGLFLFFWTEMIPTRNIWARLAYCIRIHYFSTSDFRNFKALVFADTGNNLNVIGFCK